MKQKFIKPFFILFLLVSLPTPVLAAVSELVPSADASEICVTEETDNEVFRKKVKCLKVRGSLKVCGTTTLSGLFVEGGPVIGIQYAYFYNDVPFGVGAGAEIPLGEQLFGLGIKEYGDEYATVSLPGLYEIYFNLFSTTDNEMVTVLVNDVPVGSVFKSSGSVDKWGTSGMEFLSLKPGDWTSFKTTAPITAGTFSFSIKRIAPSANRMNG